MENLISLPLWIRSKGVHRPFRVRRKSLPHSQPHCHHQQSQTCKDKEFHKNFKNRCENFKLKRLNFRMTHSRFSLEKDEDETT